ncbi:MAG: tRNA (adenosine(37)-N6)-dimethylallyltransferase [Streptosporangiales bacterium]
MPNVDSRNRLLVALYGPTSSGKTALSLDLGERLRDEHGRAPVVISADSRQVYEHMDVGTSKIRRADMRGIRHEMIDVTEPVRKLELETYVSQARGHIEACFAAGELPMIVGGTAVYLKSLLEGWEVDRTGAARRSLRRDFPPSMAADAYATLRRLDRAAAKRVHPNNYEGVINALAQAMGGREVEAGAPGAPGVTQVVLGLDRPARDLDARVAQTFGEQLEGGLLDEVVGLAERYDLDARMRRQGRKSSNQVLHTHGYREFFEVASERGKDVAALTGAEVGEIRERVVNTIQAHTRRQRGAFRKMPGLAFVRTVDDAVRRCVSTSARYGGLRY